MIVTTFGNTLVLLAILIDPNKDLRTPFNYFVANLAVADLTVGLLAAQGAHTVVCVTYIGNVLEITERFKISRKITK